MQAHNIGAVFFLVCTLALPMAALAQSSAPQDVGDAAYQAMVDKIMAQPQATAPTQESDDVAAPPASSNSTQPAYSGGSAKAGDGVQGAPQGTRKNDYVVTPVSSCTAKLPPDVAQQIKLHSLHPYQDCQRALADILSQKRRYSTALEAAKLTPETPRNFVRVITPSASSFQSDMQTNVQPDAPAAPPAGGYWKASGK